MNVRETYLNAKAVRRTTAKLFDHIKEGKAHFIYDESKMAETADFVVEVIKENYPKLNIPYHSRWGHFRAGKPERLEKFFYDIRKLDEIEQARIQFDLVIPSVLLDAGAGKDWTYKEGDDLEIGRSEGLGIASFYMFLSGAFSSADESPLQSDHQGLSSINSEKIAEAFQVSQENPLIGLEGRAGLVRSLGEAVKKHPQYFVGGRVGGLVDYMLQTYGKKIKASDILETILLSMGSIWPGRLSVDGSNLGDAWEHSALDEYVVFHKLSQWLSYSLFEPLESCGVEIVDADSMTGLAEYRNGGLFYDMGVIKLKDEKLLKESHRPDSEIILEWRALTVQLLDQISPMVKERLGPQAKDFPLAKILEGGTWWAGRKIAKKLRSDSTPPIKIKSDGTVF